MASRGRCSPRRGEQGPSGDRRRGQGEGGGEVGPPIPSQPPVSAPALRACIQGAFLVRNWFRESFSEFLFTMGKRD